MTYSDVVGVTSGLLQLAVACYALRLSSRFGTARVGWLVFGAFSLLALVHLFLAINPFGVSLDPGILAGITYGVVSALLLVSIARLETSLEKRWQAESESQKSQSAWESQVETQVVELSKANTALLRSDARLQAEIAEQKRILEQKESTCQALLTAARQTETDLLQTVSVLQTKVATLQQEQHEAIEAARRDGMSAFAARVQQGLDALKLLASVQAKSKATRLLRAAKLTQRPASRGRRLSAPLAQFAAHLASDQSTLLQRIESLRLELAQLDNAPGPAANAPAQEPAPGQNSGRQPADFREHLIDNVTETGTEAAPQPQPDALPGAVEPDPALSDSERTV